jgi:hypothetical protein
MNALYLNRFFEQAPSSRDDKRQPLQFCMEPAWTYSKRDLPGTHKTIDSIEER